MLRYCWALSFAPNHQAPALEEMHELINHVVDANAARSKSAVVMRQQECFAIKAGIDGDLDAVRKVRSEGGGKGV